MKKVIDKIVEFLTDDNFLEFLWWMVYVFWFGFVGRMIIVSDQHIIVKIIMLAGDLWWGLYAFASKHNSSNK